MLNLEPEVYPLLAIVALACSAGTYVGFHKIKSDENLRLYKNDLSKPVHQPLAFQDRKFGHQAGGHTYKDWQGELISHPTSACLDDGSREANLTSASASLGWTMIATGEKTNPVERSSLMTRASPEVFSSQSPALTMQDVCEQ